MLGFCRADRQRTLVLYEGGEIMALSISGTGSRTYRLHDLTT
ncbi:hypothetical protein NJ7G_3440 [Natrinema sp. J7-2]|nr:hypothetical protein NJ7G_3440 [Natrinema sp. J7-2]